MKTSPDTHTPIHSVILNDMELKAKRRIPHSICTHNSH